MNGGRALPSIPTWRLKHGKAKLQKEALDPATYLRGYRMEALDPNELMFKSFGKCLKSGIVLGDLHRQRLPAYVGVDLSSPSRPGNCIFVLGHQPVTNRRVVLEVRYGAWSSPQTAENLAEICGRHNVQYIMVENNAYQGSLIDWVKQSKVDFPYWMKIEAFTTGTNKADPKYGLGSIEVEMHNDGWTIPWEWETHDPTCQCDWNRWSREMSMYPKAGTSDGVMAAWFARSALNQWAFFGEGGGGVGNLNDR